MDDRHSVRVNIFGSEYTIRGEADPDYIRELSRTVDEKMKEISKNAGISLPLKVSILTAINLADEAARLRTQLDQVPLPGAPPPDTAIDPEALSALIRHIENTLQEKS